MTLHLFSFLDNVLRTVLALFMEDEALPLPSLEEVLICNPNTTAEEVRGKKKDEYPLQGDPKAECTLTCAYCRVSPYYMYTCARTYMYM